MSYKAISIILSTWVLAMPQSHANEKTATPYLDQLMGGLPQKTKVSPEDYIHSEQSKLKATSVESENGDQGRYIDRLRKGLKSESNLDSYTEIEKQKLSPETKSQATLEPLKLKRPGDIHHAIGFKIAANRDYTVSASGISTNASFDSIYGDSHFPEFSMFYEYQPFHSEWIGNIGLFGEMGVATFRGQGVFVVSLPGYSNQSQTIFRFWMVPVTVGLDYRFNLFRILRPYVMAGLTGIGYLESRNDDQEGSRGISKGYRVTAGIALLADWLDRVLSWEAYDSFKAKHSYFTFEFSRLGTISSDVDFESSNIVAGIAFEF